MRGLDHKDFGAKGQCLPERLEAGGCYIMSGRWQESQYGPTFAFDSITRTVPATYEGVTRYLQTCPGIGPKAADRLWQHFANDAVTTLRETPDLVANFGIVSEKVALKASAYLHSIKAYEATTMQLIDLVQGKGFPKSLTEDLISILGVEAPERIRRNPFYLLRFPRCGFLRVDSLYAQLGHKLDRLKRQTLCIGHHINIDREGHTWLPSGPIYNMMLAKLGGASPNMERAIELGTRARYLSVANEGGKQWVALRKHAAAEKLVAKLLAQSETELHSWNVIFNTALSSGNLAALTPHQLDGLSAALQGMICFLCGGPGTGKTFTLAKILPAAIRLWGVDQMRVSAPTGKAARRATELMREYKVPLTAHTIHTTLGGFDEYRYNAVDPLPCRLWVIDESSMIDLPLMAAALSARDRGCHVLFIGDIQQLPPVGNGAPLRDILEAGFPQTYLTEIRRNAGTIVKVCKAIREGEPWETDSQFSDLGQDDPKNLMMVHASKDDITEVLVRAVGTLASHELVKDPIEDIQVLVAVNGGNSKVSRSILNPLLQDMLNAKGEQHPDWKLRVGDKVICLRNDNGYRAKEGGNERNEARVANGEFGRVKLIEDKYCLLEFTEPHRLIICPINKALKSGSKDTDELDAAETEKAGGDATDFDLAYAVTVHKAQGSEMPFTVVALDPNAGGAHGICDRNWLMTAISRAQIGCVLVGHYSTAKSICSRSFITKRKTFLVDQINSQRRLIRRNDACDGELLEALF